MRKHRRTKAQNQTHHFKQRCEERLGVQIDRKTIQRRIRKMIFDDEELYLLRKQSNRVSLYRYKFEDKWYIIPYDKNTHKVITIFEDENQDISIEQKLKIQKQREEWSIFLQHLKSGYLEEITGCSFTDEEEKMNKNTKKMLAFIIILCFILIVLFYFF